MFRTKSANLQEEGFQIARAFEKYCSHAERGFLGVGEALAKAQVQSNPVKLSQNDLSAVALAKAEAKTQKDRSHTDYLPAWLQYF
jgi:hypothetical protein